MTLACVDEVYKSWFSCFQHIIKTHIPNKIVVIRPKDKPWMNSTIRKAIRKRNRLLNIHCKRIIDAYIMAVS